MSDEWEERKRRSDASIKLQNQVMVVSAVICASAGAYWGFMIGGIGGAIVFAVVGGVIGLALPPLLMLAGAAAIAIGTIVLIIGAIWLVIAGIVQLWGVGRP
jgi:hypothetical protein